jgi:predicted phosphodiesterase
MPNKVALLSDIHGNSPALRAVLENIQRQGCEMVFMLGDIINGVDPHGCVQLLRSWVDENRVDLACIKGNAEAYLTTPDRHLLPKQEEEWNTDMIHLVQWWQDHLSASDIEWIDSFPDTLHWNDAYLVHDSPLDRIAVQNNPGIPPEYREWFFHGRGLVPATDQQTWQNTATYMDQHRIKQVFCGHTHVPFQKIIDGKLICNIGSAGMPLDGDYRSSWVLMENEVVTIKRVAYDVSLIHALIEDNPDYYDFKMPGYRDAYKKSIATGLHWREHIQEQ